MCVIIQDAPNKKFVHKIVLYCCKIFGLTQIWIISILTTDKQRHLKYKYWITAASGLHTEGQLLVDKMNGNFKLTFESITYFFFFKEYHWQLYLL